MQQENIAEKIIALTAEQLGLNVIGVERESQLVSGLGADSLDMIEIIMAMEEEFEVDIDDFEAERFATVGDIITHVSALVS